MMVAAESAARACGKTLLVLDAVTGGDAARLYERLGWVRVGDIPGYALMPRGGLCSTTVYYRDLGTSSASINTSNAHESERLLPAAKASRSDPVSA